MDKRCSSGLSNLSHFISLCLSFIHIYLAAKGSCASFFHKTESSVVLVPLVKKTFTASVLLCFCSLLEFAVGSVVSKGGCVAIEVSWSFNHRLKGRTLPHKRRGLQFITRP